MASDWDVSYIFYAVGALFGLAAAVYFGKELILNLSPVSKSVILLLGFAAFFEGANYTSKSSLRRALYIFSAASYLVFLVFTISEFSLSTNYTFLALLLSSILFVSLGYLFKERNFDIDRGTAKRVTIGSLAAILALLIFDVAGAQTTHDLQLESSVNATGRNKLKIGALEVRNNFLLPRNFEEPNYRACVYTPEKEILWVSVEDRVKRNDIISGRSTENLTLTTSLPGRVERINGEEENRFAGLGVLTVEKVENCPDEPQPDKLLVTERKSID